MSEREEFRSTILAHQAEAEAALALRGDVEPRLALWSRRDPVTLFGAWGPCKTGWAEVSRTFRWVAERFTQSTVSDFRYDVEVAEVSGDLAYTVGYERFTAAVGDGPAEPYTVRVTHVYRRENGEWKIVHRHGDLAPPDQSPPAEEATTVCGTAAEQPTE
jgi:ketosteroid isomerase-like protein